MLFLKVGVYFFLGLFMLLKGLQLMRGGLQETTGQKVKLLLQKMTSNIYKGILLGTVISGVIQSSGLLTVIVISFVDSGLITLRQGFGVVLGANIGTTITAQIIAFHIENSLLFLLLVLGLIMLFWKKQKVFRYAGRIILGLGLIFSGINTMGAAMKPLHNCQLFLDLLTHLGHNYWLGILLGVFFTAFIQSSSAATGIIIALASQELISLPSSICFILGSNIGSCVTGLLASIGTSLAARRVAVAHLFLNIVGVVSLLPFLSTFSNLVEQTAISISRQIANAHTIFNIYNTLIIIPFTDILIRLVTILITKR